VQEVQTPIRRSSVDERRQIGALSCLQNEKPCASNKQRGRNDFQGERFLSNGLQKLPVGLERNKTDFKGPKAENSADNVGREILFHTKT
jgi:hypothetical protein